MEIFNLKGKLQEFISHLKREEYAANSVRSYHADILGLIEYLNCRGELCSPLQKEMLIEYKKSLQNRLSPSSVNRNIAAINKFLQFLDLDDFKLKTLKIQEYTTADNELTESEFNELLKTSFNIGKNKIALIMLTLVCTGIRIGELQFITLRAAEVGKAVINNKGTIRTVVIHTELRQYLLRYCRENDIKSGAVFIGRGGNPISRSYVASAMKDVARKCGIDIRKVFPHNLRHYFARRFLDCGNQLTDLADILGHKNINTTRRYLRVNEKVLQKQILKMKLFPRNRAVDFFERWAG